MCAAQTRSVRMVEQETARESSCEVLPSLAMLEEVGQAGAAVAGAEGSSNDQDLLAMEGELEGLR